jgi:hypothetical protein
LEPKVRLFGDEATFHIPDYANRQSLGICGTSNSHARDSATLDAVCAVFKQKVFRPFTFSESIMTVGGSSC